MTQIIEGNKTNWANRYFLGLACKKAQDSPDNSTQCGACLLADDGIPGNAGKDRIHVDCNRFSTLPSPPDYAHLSDLLIDRNKKLAWIEHAERNVLFSAINMGVNVQGSTLFAPWAACTDCARAIKLLGVKEVVRLPKATFTPWHPVWKDSIDEADDILARGGVIVTEYDGPPLDATLLFNKTYRKV